MAALVTLTEAYTHLRLSFVLNTSPVDPRQTDLDAKRLQASDIVLDYLKGRPIPLTSITSSGGIATVTTPYPHGLTTNDVVRVIGTAEPEYSGSFVSTVTSTTTFTVPISGSPASPAAGGRLFANFTWTDVTVPTPVKAAILLVLTHLWDHRGEDMAADENLWNAVGRLLARMRDPAVA